MNIEIFNQNYSTAGTQDDRAESFKLAATAVHKDMGIDRPFTGDETRTMFAAADAADQAVNVGGTI